MLYLVCLLALALPLQQVNAYKSTSVSQECRVSRCEADPRKIVALASATAAVLHSEYEMSSELTFLFDHS